MRAALFLILAIALAVPARANTFVLLASNSSLYAHKSLSTEATARLESFCARRIARLCAQRAFYADAERHESDPFDEREDEFVLLCDNVAVYVATTTIVAGEQKSIDGGATFRSVHAASGAVESDEAPLVATLDLVRGANGESWAAVRARTAGGPSYVSLGAADLARTLRNDGDDLWRIEQLTTLMTAQTMYLLAGAMQRMECERAGAGGRCNTYVVIDVGFATNLLFFATLAVVVSAFLMYAVIRALVRVMRHRRDAA
jgi:hypothetical protein